MKKERRQIPIGKTVSYGLVGWILSVTIISAPFISCQQAFTKPQVSTSVSQLSGSEKLSTAEKNDASSSVVSNVQVGKTERLSSSKNGITINIDKDNSFLSVVDENERQAYRKLYPRTMRSADEDSFTETEVSSENGLDFILDTSVPLNDVDMLVYNKIKQNVSADSRLDSEAIASNVDSLIDLSDLESDIQEKLSSDERFVALSRNAQDELTEEDIATITQAVQETMDDKGPVLATQVLPAAEDMDSASDEVVLDTLNSPVDGMEDAAFRTMANAKKNNSRSVSSNPTVVSTRRELRDILMNTRNSDYSQTKTGDLLYVYGPGLGDVVTGHGAFWDKTKQSFFTADVPTDGTVFDAKTTYFLPEHQLDGKTSDTAMKLLHVDSLKTEEERQEAIKKSYDAYNNRWYLIQPFKRFDCLGLYCSQVAWLTWNRMDVDIDGTAWCTSFFAQTLIQKVVPVTICLGWWKITVYITIFLLVVTLVTLDLIYPWDMVIDDDTKEYARFGVATPGQ